MEITARYQNSNAILRLSGNILGDDRLKLYEAIQEQLESGYTNIILNFEKIDLMDSVGLGVLIAAHKSLSRAGAKLALSNVGASVNYLLTIARLNRILDKYDTEDDALSSFQA
jgi:anti-anti-sigma factor